MSQIIRGIVLIFFCSYATSSPLPQEGVQQQEVAVNTVVQQPEGQLLVNQITPYSFVYHGHHNANSFKVFQQPQIQSQVLLHQPFGAMPVQQTVEQMKQPEMKMTEENKDMAQKTVPFLHHVPLNYHQYIPQYQPQYQPLFQYYPSNPYYQQQYVLVPLAQQAKSEIHDQMGAPNKEMKMSDDTVELTSRNENVEENVEENADVEEPKIGSAEAIDY